MEKRRKANVLFQCGTLDSVCDRIGACKNLSNEWINGQTLGYTGKDNWVSWSWVCGRMYVIYIVSYQEEKTQCAFIFLLKQTTYLLEH